MNLKCPKCGASYSSASNYESHYRGVHFGEPPQLSNAKSSDSSYEVGIVPDEDARASTPAGQILHLGMPEPDSRPIAQPARVFHFTCPACGLVMDSKSYPLCLNENQLQEWHFLENPNCKDAIDAKATQAAQEAAELSKWKHGVHCERCGIKIFSQYQYDRHIAKHDADALRKAREQSEASKRADVTLERIKAALAVNPNLTPSELSRILQIPRTTVRDALSRLSREDGAMNEGGGEANNG